MSPSSLLSFFMACETIGHFEVRIIFVCALLLFPLCCEALFRTYPLEYLKKSSSSSRTMNSIRQTKRNNSIIWPTQWLSNEHSLLHSWKKAILDSMRIALWSPIIYVIQIISMWFWRCCCHFAFCLPVSGRTSLSLPFRNGIVLCPGIRANFCHFGDYDVFLSKVNETMCRQIENE